MPWNTVLFDSTGKIKDSGLSTLKTLTGTPSIDETVASGVAIFIPADLFVQDDGLDSNPGTEGSPFLTLNKAISVVSPGQIIEMRKAGGGTWTYINYVEFDVDGTEANKIQLRVRTGDRVNFYPAAPRRENWRFAGSSYWVIDGTNGEMYIGDRSLWTGAAGGTDTYPQDLNIWQEGGVNHHIDFQSVHFSGSAEYTSIAVNGDFGGFFPGPSHHWRFKDCTMKNHGRLEIGFGDTGDGISIGGHSNILDNCTFENFGGHNMLQLCARTSLVRNNDFNADFHTNTTNAVGTGYRAIAISDQILPTSVASNDSVPPYGPTLFEGNIIRNAGWDEDLHEVGDISGNNASYKQAKSRTIWRYNYIFDNIGYECAAINELLPSDNNNPPDSPNVEFNRDYNNTYDNNVAMYYYSNGSPSDGVNGQQQWYINNIYSNLVGGTIAKAGGFSSDNIVLWRNTQSHTLQGYPDKWIGSKWANNMIDSTNYGIWLHELGGGGANHRETTLAGAIAEWPAVWEASNNTNAPTYVDVNAKTKAGFALDTGSNGLGEAEHMATITANGGGQVLTVDDAYWIYDGFDLSYFGPDYDADFIAIYDSDGVSNERIRQVLTVNNQTTVIVTASVTVANGDKIWPAPGGISPSKNLGAGQ